jgi:hypothetical protein
MRVAKNWHDTFVRMHTEIFKKQIGKDEFGTINLQETTEVTRSHPNRNLIDQFLIRTCIFEHVDNRWQAILSAFETKQTRSEWTAYTLTGNYFHLVGLISNRGSQSSLKKRAGYFERNFVVDSG